VENVSIRDKRFRSTQLGVKDHAGCKRRMAGKIPAFPFCDRDRKLQVLAICRSGDGSW